MAAISVYSPDQRQTLLEIAAASIAYSLKHYKALPVQIVKYQLELQALRATFVTLYLNEKFQGCIGALRAIRPLALDVARNAHSAAFEDPRGGAIREPDLKRLKIIISVLSEAEPMQFKNEADVIAQLRPGVDGVIFEDGGRVGTLLPSVWESLIDPRAFFEHTKLKAGLSAHYWSPTVIVKRYTTESFSNGA
ncbi:MAG: AmmeMemoRadiSam system protein A [Planctomycetota bacterium]